MAYECVECGRTNVVPLKAKKFEAAATIPRGCKDEGDVAFEDKTEESKKLFLKCNNCNNFGSAFDKKKFKLI